MTDHPAILMFAGAAIGATVSALFWWPHLAKAQRALADLRGRAAATAQSATEYREICHDMLNRREQSWRFAEKLQRATETLNAAAAQNTMAAARKVIAEGLERVRCAGERDDIDGGEG